MKFGVLISVVLASFAISAQAKVQCSIVGTKDFANYPYAFDDTLLETTFDHVTSEGDTHYYLVGADRKTVKEITGDDLDRRRSQKDFAGFEGGLSISMEVYDQGGGDLLAMITYRDIDTTQPMSLGAGSLVMGHVNDKGFFGAPVKRGISVGCANAGN